MDCTTKTSPVKVASYLRRLYRPIGFHNDYSFALWFVLGGALMGFSCARLKYLDFRGVLCPENPLQGTDGAVPGECYYFEEPRGRAGIILHLAGILPAAILVVFQFIPVLRQACPIFHRINGYIIILLSTVSMAGVLVIAKPTFGGTLDMQAATGTATTIFLVCQSLAVYNVKRLQIEQHRAWMLRAWVSVSFIITMRIISIIIAMITSKKDPQYTIGSCKVIDYIYFHNSTVVETLYSDCAKFYSGESLDQRVIIRGDLTSSRPEQKAAGLNVAFGAGAWLALAIHCIAAELYLRLTPAEAERLRRVSYQRQLKAGMKNPGNAGLTAQKMGDALPWSYPGTQGFVCQGATPDISHDCEQVIHHE
ncbi:hypothetical protein BGZ63DRAFT_360725 [Mariannaea sp. PMI_226]|nr:hypothetical protein BGZ63DRAFT_360725 [Mariannaea sp. PMI_226]